jgi:hypothetical protein
LLTLLKELDSCVKRADFLEESINN